MTDTLRTIVAKAIDPRAFETWGASTTNTLVLASQKNRRLAAEGAADRVLAALAYTNTEPAELP